MLYVEKSVIVNTGSTDIVKVETGTKQKKNHVDIK